MLPPQARFQERRVQLDPGRDVGAECTGSAEIARRSEAEVAESQPDTILPCQRRMVSEVFESLCVPGGDELRPKAFRELWPLPTCEEDRLDTAALLTSTAQVEPVLVVLGRDQGGVHHNSPPARRAVEAQVQGDRVIGRRNRVSTALRVDAGQSRSYLGGTDGHALLLGLVGVFVSPEAREDVTQWSHTFELASPGVRTGR